MSLVDTLQPGVRLLDRRSGRERWWTRTRLKRMVPWWSERGMNRQDAENAKRREGKDGGRP